MPLTNSLQAPSPSGNPLPLPSTWQNTGTGEGPSVSASKVVTLAEHAHNKQLEYYERLAQKRTDYENILERKKSEESSLDVSQTPSPLTEDEDTDLRNWVRRQKYNQVFVDSFAKNQDAWFDSNTFTGYLGNLVTAFGARAISDVGGNLAKAPFSLTASILRQNLGDEDLNVYNNITTKEDKGIPLSPEEQVFKEGGKFFAAKSLKAAEFVIEDVDRATKQVLSIVDSFGTDLTHVKLEDGIKGSLEYFKQGTPEGVFKGIASYLNAIRKLAVEDPGAAVQFTVETLPFTLALAYKFVPSVAVLATNLTEEAVQDFMEEYGRKPDAKEFAIAAGLSTASAGLDAIGSRLVIFGSAAARNILSLAKSGGIQVSRTVKQRLLRAMVRTGAIGSEAFLVEGTTEFTQGVLHQLAGKQDLSKVDLVEPMIEGAIGAIAGTGMAGPRMVTRPITSLAEDAVENRIIRATNTIDQYLQGVPPVDEFTKFKGLNVTSEQLPKITVLTGELIQNNQQDAAARVIKALALQYRAAQETAPNTPLVKELKDSVIGLVDGFTQTFKATPFDYQDTGTTQTDIIDTVGSVSEGVGAKVSPEIALGIPENRIAPIDASTEFKSYKGKITPEKNTIFVFGSNPEGRHGAGAAKTAVQQFGAVRGRGEGLQGNAYGLPTKDLSVKENSGLRSIPLEQITENVIKLYETAKANPDKQFKVAFTNVEKATLNGYTGIEMMGAFSEAGTSPSNVIFSEEWVNSGHLKPARAKVLSETALGMSESKIEPTGSSTVSKQVGPKLTPQLANKIITNPVKVTLQKDRGATANVSRKLSEIVKPKDSAPTNVFQKVANVFKTTPEAIAEATGVNLRKATSAQKGLLKELFPFAYRTEKVVNSLFRGVARKDTKGNQPNVPYISDLAKDATNYFIQEDPLTGQRSIDPNVSGIIATVGFQWLTTTGTQTLFNDFDAIKAILGKSSDDVLTTSEIEALTDAGVPTRTLVQSLGNIGFNMLQLEARNDQQAHKIAQLKLALGQMILANLIDQGYVTLERRNIDTILEKDPEWGQLPEELDQFLDTVFAKIATQTKDNAIVPASNVQILLDAVPEGETTFLNKVFGVEFFTVAPTFKPVKIEDGLLVQDSMLEVAPDTKKAMQVLNNQAWKTNDALTNIVTKLSSNTLELIAGFKSTVGMHVDTKQRTDGNNRTIRRELQNFKDFIKDYAESGSNRFYFSYVQWKTGRLGIRNNTVNPQASKVHRALVQDPSWTHTFKTSDVDALSNFEVAIAQGFGLDSTETNRESWIGDYRALMTNPVIIAGVSAIQALNNNQQLTAEQENVIVAASAVGGENFHSFQALVELTNAVGIVAEGTTELVYKDEDITSSMTVEIDGKTNGYAWVLTQSAMDFTGRAVPTFTARLERLLNAVGMFFNGEITSYADWKSVVATQPRLDIYEHIADQVTASLAEMGSPLLRHWFGLIDPDSKTPLVISRKFVKKSSLAFLFGSGPDAIKVGLVDSVMAALYEEMATFAPGGTKTDAELEVFNKLIQDTTASKKFSLPREEALTRRFTLQEEQGITAFIGNTAGSALTTGLFNTFPGVRRYRTAINYATSAMYIVFNKVYEEALVAKELELGRAVTKDERKDLARSLQNILPSFAGPFSTDLSNYISVVKTSKRSDPSIKNQQEYSKKLANNAGHSLTTRGEGFWLNEPGVLGLISYIHHLDSAVQQKVLTKYRGLNIHDATVGSFMDFKDRASYSNEMFVELSKEAGAIERISERLSEILADPMIAEHIIYLDDVLAERASIAEYKALERNPESRYRAPVRSIETLQKYVKDTSTWSTNIRKEIFSQLSSVDQYIGPDGYIITDASPKGTLTQLKRELNAAFKDVIALGTPDIKDPLESLPSTSDDTESSGAKPIKEQYTLDPISLVETFEKLSQYRDVPGTAEDNVHLREIFNRILKVIVNVPDIDLTIDLTGSTESGRGTYFSNKNSDVFEGHRIELTVNRGSAGIEYLSNQGVFVHELVHALSWYALHKSPVLKREIAELYALAKEQMTPESMVEIDPVTGERSFFDINNARHELEYAFNHDKGLGLHEFIAMGVTSPYFRRGLSKLNRAPKRQGDSIWDGLVHFFEKMLQNISDWLRGYAGKTPDIILAELLFRVNVINDKHSHLYKRKENLLQRADERVAGAIDGYVMSPIHKLLRGVKGAIGIVPDADFFEAMYEVKHRLRESKNILSQAIYTVFFSDKSPITQGIKEIVSPVNKYNEPFQRALRMSKQAIDRAKNNASGMVERFINEGFLIEPTTEEKIALKHIMIDSNLHMLFKSYSKDDLIGFFKDDALIRQELVDVIKQVQKISAGTETETARKKYIRYILNMSNLLGLFMATGDAKGAEIQLNTHNIVHQLGVGDRSIVTNLDKDTEHRLTNLLDKLSALYALRYSTPSDKVIAVRVFEAEYEADGKANGVTRIADTLQKQRRDALTMIFQDNPTLMMQNYSKDITNPSVEVGVSHIKNDPELLARNYVMVGDSSLQLDPNDITGKPSYLYRTSDTLNTEWVRGAFSLTNKQQRGTVPGMMLESDPTKPGSIRTNEGVTAMHTANQAAIEKYQTTILKDIDKVENRFAVPTRSTDPSVYAADYRYMMNHQAKRELLEQKEDIARVIGFTEGSIHDKHQTAKINEDVIEVLDKDFRENYERFEKSYVDISPDSSNPEYRQLYAMLPHEAKQHLGIFDGTGFTLPVREELLHMLFGYRKASIINLKVGNTEVGRLANDFLKATNDMLLMNFPKLHYKGPLPLKALETKFQDMFRIVKDMIVVKSAIVPIGNAMSNTLILIVKGMTSPEAFRSQMEAYKLTVEYQQLYAEKYLLDLVTQTEQYRKSTAEQDKIKKRLLYLNHQIDNHIMKDFIDEGLFQTIIEDLDLSRREYDTSSKILKALDEYATKNFNPSIITAGKWMWMSKDTPIYKALFRLISYGDFAARYALFQHRAKEEGLTNELKKKDLKAYNALKEKILQESIRTFVYYDTPTSPQLQWINDMGIFPFTKFLLRIQMVMLEMFKTRPVSSLALITFKDIMDTYLSLDLSYINDSQLWQHFWFRLRSPWEAITSTFSPVPLLKARIGF